MNKYKKKSFQINDETQNKLTQLAELFGLSETSILVMAIHFLDREFNKGE